MQNTNLRTVQKTIGMLTSLLGVWTGQGKGIFPTIDSFDYFETLRIQRDPTTLFLTYEQSAELIDPEGRAIRKSHWEAGVLKPMEDGSVELACVQGSGRVEVLRGKLLIKASLPETIILRFKSTLIGNDEKVKSTTREWILTGDHLKYVLKMATTRVEKLSLHLEADLFKD
jgi:hypothetical protein